MVEGLGLSHLRETDWEAGEAEERGTSAQNRVVVWWGCVCGDGRFPGRRASPEPRGYTVALSRPLV